MLLVMDLDSNVMADVFCPLRNHLAGPRHFHRQLDREVARLKHRENLATMHKLVWCNISGLFCRCVVGKRVLRQDLVPGPVFHVDVHRQHVGDGLL